MTSTTRLRNGKVTKSVFLSRIACCVGGAGLGCGWILDEIELELSVRMWRENMTNMCVCREGGGEGEGSMIAVTPRCNTIPNLVQSVPNYSYRIMLSHNR